MAVEGTLLEVRGAGFRYGARPVFCGLEFDVLRGEVLCVLGPNGCGKSTLLRCIGGALPLTSGSVRLEGRELSAFDAAARARRIGYLFQRHAASFPYSVLDVVLMGRTPHMGMLGAPSPRDRAIAEASLARVGMADFSDRVYSTLSGGELQLVLLARTLAQQPDLILLDEPTSHLDLGNQVLSLRVIGALAAEGVTMVMTTHDPNHAFLLPGRALLMRPGGAIRIGSAAEILTEEALSAAYGVDIAVRTVPRAMGEALRICSPW